MLKGEAIGLRTVLEGTARQGWYSRGRWHDVVICTMIRDDLA